VGACVDLTVRAAGTAGLRASTEGLVNDGLDGACTPAAFSAAAEATVDLLGIARQIFRSAHGTADIVVGQEVAGTNNHENAQVLVMRHHRYSRPWQVAKGKTVFSSDSKLILDTG
jgi:hypothetical protein